jgi:hypothetical protein
MPVVLNAIPSGHAPTYREVRGEERKRFGLNNMLQVKSGPTSGQTFTTIETAPLSTPLHYVPAGLAPSPSQPQG